MMPLWDEIISLFKTATFLDAIKCEALLLFNIS